MAIASFKPNPITNRANIPKTNDPSYKPNYEDTRINPINSLVQYVTGTNWNVDWYQAVNTEHTDLRNLDRSASGVHQTYRLIKDLPIKISQSISQGFDESTGVMTVTGSATILPYVIPNKGDLFVAGAGLEDRAIYQLTSIERKTYQKNSVYEINFELYTLESNNNELFSNLKDRIIQTFSYSAERILDGFNPIIITSEYEALQDLAYGLELYIREYYRLFHDKRTGALLVPNGTKSTYDHHVAKFMKQITSTHEAPEVIYSSLLNFDADPYISIPSIYDVIMNRDPNRLKLVHHKFGLIPGSSLTNSLRLNNPTYLGINYIVYPLEPEIVYKPDRTYGSVTVSSLTNQSNIVDLDVFKTKYNKMIPINGIAEYPLLPYINSSILSQYLFPLEFYQGKANRSILERQIYLYLYKQDLSILELRELLSTIDNWGLVEQFYYAPIVMLLVKTAINKR